MRKQDNKKQISKAEIQGAIEAGTQEHDVFRSQAMQSLSVFRRKKDILYVREQQRLTQKYSRQDARVQATELKQNTNADFIRGLGMEINRANTQVPVINERSWLVHGYVYDREGCPLASTDVTLYRLDGQRVTEIPSVKTNNNGYYKLSYEASVDKVNRLTETDASTEPMTAATGISDKQATDSGLRININRPTDDGKNTVFVRAMLTNNSDACADSTPMVPELGAVNYRDIIINTSRDKNVDKPDRRSGRYLGNSSTRELHDLKNEKAGCRIDAIRFDHCIAFKSQKPAIEAGYDYCAYCFGKDKSKR